VAGAVWLATYRVPATTEYIEYVRGIRNHFHASERVFEPAWWGAWAAVALLVFGVAITGWLLPERLSLIRRFANRFAKPS